MKADIQGTVAPESVLNGCFTPGSRHSGNIGEVEFIIIMTFDSLQNVINFQGEDYLRCYVPDAAKRLLNRWDQTSAHFEVREVRSYE